MFFKLKIKAIKINFHENFNKKINLNYYFLLMHFSIVFIKICLFYQNHCFLNKKIS